MGLSKDDIRDALRTVQVPGFGRDLVSGGALEWAASCDGYIGLKLHLPDLEREAMTPLAHACAKAIATRHQPQSCLVEFVDHAGDVVQTVRVDAQRASHAPDDQASSGGSGGGSGHRPIGGLQETKNPLSKVRHIIAVGAGKGGVGKSTISVNLAVGLARKGHAVGLMDGDIYGPSLPTMLGLDSLETNVHAGKLQPFNVHGIKSMTIGKLVDPDKPLIWRGPMAHGAFKQLSEQTAWGELDYLIIDLPPGTGDVPLTMAQSLQLTGAVIVCTPQRVAQDDALRAVRMFQQLNIEILGVVENMSYFIGDDGKEYDIFGRGGAEQMAQRLGVPFLGAVPITMSLREHSDTGDPTANFEERGSLSKALESMVKTFEGQTALAAMRLGQSKPTLSIS